MNKITKEISNTLKRKFKDLTGINEILNEIENNKHIQNMIKNEINNSNILNNGIPFSDYKKNVI